VDLLKQIYPPVALAGSSLATIQRQLDRRRERLERAMNARSRRDFVPQSRNLRVPSVAKLEKLEKLMATLPVHRKCLKRADFSIYLEIIQQLYDAIMVAIRRIRRIENRDAHMQHLARIGAIFLDADDAVLSTFIIGRRNHAGRNLHAAALERMRDATRQQYSEWGRRGGEATQRKRRLSAMAATRPSPSDASPSESSASSALESV
jgi:hypothetical protein